MNEENTTFFDTFDGANQNRFFNGNFILANINLVGSKLDRERGFLENWIGYTAEGSLYFKRVNSVSLGYFDGERWPAHTVGEYVREYRSRAEERARGLRLRPRWAHRGPRRAG